MTTTPTDSRFINEYHLRPLHGAGHSADHDYVRLATERLHGTNADEQPVTDRQRILPHFDQSAIEEARALLIGAGGINGGIGEALVRKGIGELLILDHDVVELSNLNRQKFYREDVWQPKATALARNLAREATCGTVIEGHALSFQDAVALGMDMTATAAICGIDNTIGRVEVARHFLATCVPVIFIAVDLVAENGYVFVQEPGQACFGCAFPRCMEDRSFPCRTPAVKDILMAVSGLALYAFDSLIMSRQRAWNYRNVHLAGVAPSTVLTVERRPDCPICGPN